MAIALLHNINHKKNTFNRSLTITYWKNQANSVLLGLLESMAGKLAEKLIFHLEDLSTTLMSVYKEAGTISAEEVDEVYPDVREMRKVITSQNSRFADINYMDSDKVRIKFRKLVRLINHLEARIQKQKYKDDQPEPAPSYLKKKMKDNSRKMIEHAAL